MTNEPTPSKRRGRPPKNRLEVQPESNIGEKALQRERERSQRVCRELLEGYTDDFSLTEDGEIDYDQYSESSVAAQWGLHRGKISRMIRAIYGSKSKNANRANLTDEESAQQQLVPLSLAELVEILGSLAHRPQTKKPLTKEDTLRIIQRFVELCPEERHRLSFNAGNYNAILQQIIRVIELDQKNDYLIFDLLKFYETLLARFRASYLDLEIAQEDATQDTSSKLDESIKRLIKKILIEQKVESSNESVAKFFSIIKSELAKLEASCGLSSISLLTPEDDLLGGMAADRQRNRGEEITSASLCGEGSNKKHKLNNLFIQSLVQAVVENELLIQEIPIQLQHYDIKEVRYLPLVRGNAEQGNAVLNSAFSSLEKWTIGLEKQHAYTVSLYLNVKLPLGFQPLFPLDNAKKNEENVSFFIKSSGIGGQITHLTRLINLSLFKDIPCLEDYFPIAHDIILITPEILQQSNSSPLAYHTLIMLCKKKYVEEAAKQKKTYDEVCSDQQPFYGNYCGFDLLECAVNSSLFARLRAIKKIGTNTNIYLRQFCDRAERENELREALSYLKSYPFSLLAMQSHLEKTIFNEVLSGGLDQSATILESEITKEDFQRWSIVTREAYLELIDTYLTAGLYKSAKRLIDKIEKYIDDDEFANCLTSTLRTKFAICRARYWSIFDLDEHKKQDKTTNLSRSKTVENALAHLRTAEKLLKQRLKKYAAIDELAQSQFSPFFHLYAQIYFYRAKLHLFYRIYHEPVDSIREKHLKPIYLLEQARIFAAMDGNLEFYSYYSAYQAIAYIVHAFLVGNPEPGFKRHECLRWASKLIENAIICYSEIGNESYQKIKEKSGIGTENEREKNTSNVAYGKYIVQTIPSIIEITQNNNEAFYFRQELDKHNEDNEDNKDNKFIFLDMAALCVRQEHLRHFNLSEIKGVYLFGTYASLILFARALNTLCNAEIKGRDKENRFFAKVELASRMFTYAWATAEDSCASTNLNDSDKSKVNFCLERKFFEDEGSKNNPEYKKYWKHYYKDFSNLYKLEIAYIRDIYPHRLNEIADFGKIFAGVCKYLLLFCNEDTCYDNGDLKKDIGGLMDKLHSPIKNPIDQPDYHSQQDRFNGHLSEAFQFVKRYMELRLEAYESEGTSVKNLDEVVSIRDEVVKKILEYLFEQSP